MRKKRDWPHTMAQVAYLCAGLAVVLVFVQFWLYTMRFDRLFNSEVVTSITLSNGQTYFGHLQKYGPNTFVLSDVYYLQVDDEADAAETADESNIKLVHLTEDFHQPHDYLILNRDQVLFWQHLQSDSPIIDAIQQFEEQ